MSKKNEQPQIGIVMGSDSDLSVMEGAAEMLMLFEIPFELTIVSAHRTPERLAQYAQSAHQRGIRVIIAGAGGAAHLPGMLAAYTPAPVIGVPVKSSNSIDGWDSILSILQMPKGVPVATVALDGAANAGILAAEIIGAFDEEVYQRLEEYKSNAMKEKVHSAVEKVRDTYPNSFDT